MATGNPADRLDSWKEIAAYLRRDVRTVQRWEKKEGLPVHRHLHDKLGSIFAYRNELAEWFTTRQTSNVATDKQDSQSEKIKLAVLRFGNLSGNAEDDYFSDGLAEEIINVLAHAPGMKVAGRTSSFFFRGKDVEFGEIGRRLYCRKVPE